MDAAMDSLKLAFDPLDLEIIDRVYEVAWAYTKAREPFRDTASDAGQPLLMENPGKPIDDGQAVFQGDVPFASKHREFV